MMDSEVCSAHRINIDPTPFPLQQTAASARSKLTGCRAFQECMEELLHQILKLSLCMLVQLSQDFGNTAMSRM